MWPNTENSIVIDFCTLLVLCLVGYVLMSQSTSSRSSKKDQKKRQQQQQKAVDKADPWTRFTAEMAEKAWNVLSVSSGAWVVSLSTFALYLMAVLTQTCSSCKCCFQYCKIHRSTQFHLLCISAFDLLFRFVFLPWPFGEICFILLGLQQKSWDKWNIFIREERNIPSRREKALRPQIGVG